MKRRANKNECFTLQSNGQIIKGKVENIMLPRALNEVIFTYIAVIQLTITRKERAWFPFQALPFPVNQVKLR